MAITDTETFRALVSQGPVVIMVEKTHMLALLDERDELREALTALLIVTDFAHQVGHFVSRSHIADTGDALTKAKNVLYKNTD